MLDKRKTQATIEQVDNSEEFTGWCRTLIQKILLFLNMKQTNQFKLYPFSIPIEYNFFN